ncbi:sulfatase [Reichenbachiella carrageenanivorans]|uniref:Sulfatase n=1 Tax=Reichenbachiella carrageenanivorans TaxID=2979869 RepID=A0ABY6D0Z4_9BACT|nr:sulfatase [Reichenbachiella carrageenanivorans]UXX79827.1 sulfatase [Reichenbachiella carrageenanivorans]
MKRITAGWIGLWLLCHFGAMAQDKNVLFIIIDDLKPLIHSYGESQMITPNLDAFTAESVAFTNAHCQQAVCAPSRVSFMTGMRPDYTRVWDLKTNMRDMNPDILTMPQYFKQNGYETIGMGKVLHGAKKNDPRSWSLPFVEDIDLDYAEGYEIPANFKYQSPEIQKVYQEMKNDFPGDPTSDKVWLAVNQAFKKRGINPSTECIDVPDDAYADGALVTKSIATMEMFQKGKKPFFIAVGFHKPHLPFVAPKKYWDLYDRDQIQLASFQAHAEGSPAFAYHTFGELKNYSDIKKSLDENGAVIPDKQRELIHGYYASVSYVDAQVGLLMEYLKSSGLDKTTTVVLIGDHGWHLGDHGLWNKHSNFEQATRTPLMVKSPDYTFFKENDSPVELVDVFPTICELSGLQAPNHLQGQSLVPIVSGEKTAVKSFAISQYPRGERMGYAIRNDRYRYVEWYEGDFDNRTSYDETKVVARELYDYQEDPLETKNWVNEASKQAVLATMQTELRTTIWESNEQ